MKSVLQLFCNWNIFNHFNWKRIWPPHLHMFNRRCHYCVPLLETSLRMAT